MRRSVILGLALSLLVGGGGTIWAQRPAELLRLREYLGLTPEQVTQIQERLKAYRNEIFPLQQQLRAKSHELRLALDAPQPNATAIGQLVLERRALRQQLREKQQKLRADLEALLTPEQKQKLTEWRQMRPPLRPRRWGFSDAQIGRPFGLPR
ncbi:MAG: Spy/CpxP family protein refolding chaperone [Blastocatellia bacterium]|nr:Spy/CpxP family protein refolding chaperone [Blastocatellia bacterium]MCS7157386.1 Spy/CpxP family protein refolding chaperone [Blastocatellia bacterium]MCX7753252.1 Spy/CpxP family protein refolding chaperone [Blastocatellia bacterium]MDW8168291.1 Spy/CpxP family protein refolding chaperone [Acidobacteriota bacterium]MDW8255416.1 Spy/CpxP family protein refolding chaperone [Acidobacteriota bacterium]